MPNVIDVDSAPSSEDSSPAAPCVTTVLFGAGASADAGMPLGKTLDSQLGQSVSAYQDDAAAAWDYLLPHAGNFEDVYRLARQLGTLQAFGLLVAGTEPANHAAGAKALAGHEWDKDRPEAAGCLAWMAAEVLGQKLDDVDMSYLDPLDSVMQRQGRLTISTLNYDSVVETWAASRPGYLQNDDPEAWTPGTPWHPPSAGRLQLLKLHGSADWCWKSLSPIGYRATGLPVVRRWDEPGTNSDPAIILGAGNKLRPGGPFLALLEAFSASLEAADHLVVVGYSFADVHVNARIGDWFDRDPARRFITVVSRSWPTDPTDPTQRYPSGFAELLDHRLRLGSSGGATAAGLLAAPQTGAPRLRAVRKPAKLGLAEALECPDVPQAVDPLFKISLVEPGRTSDLLT